MSASSLQPAGRPSGPSATAPLDEATFALLRDLIHRSSGIHLREDKGPLLVGRLNRRLRALGLPSFEAYYRHLMEETDGTEMATMLEHIVTHETRFFREARQFDFLETRVLPRWRSAGDRGLRARRIRAWSAACSTGEEAYSLAMCLLEHFPERDGWRVEVVGTDLSMRVLETARAGEWSIAGATSIPGPYLKRFMRRGTGSREGRMRAGPELRAAVRFRQVNLHDARYGVDGPFDLVLCRNVLIYFAEPARTAALDRVAGHVRPGGYLLLGHAESPGRGPEGLELVQATVFRAPVRPRGPER